MERSIEQLSVCRYFVVVFDTKSRVLNSKKYINPLHVIKMTRNIPLCDKIMPSIMFMPFFSSRTMAFCGRLGLLLKVSSLACLEIREEIWRRLIVHETGFPR